MRITPDNSRVGTHRTGGLVGISADEISETLGFRPNVSDDPSKVVNSWQFRIGRDVLAIWDYKGSHKYGSFSTFGDAQTLQKIFGSHYT